MGPGRLSSRSGYLLLAGAVGTGFLSTEVLVRRHVEYLHGQYEYWETYPLSPVGFAIGLLLTGALAVAGIAVVAAAAVRRGPRPPETTLDHRRWVGSVALVLASLVLLNLGHFIQFDDTSGFGSDRWVMWLGVLAALTAITSLLVALPSPSARRVLAGTAMLVVALTVWGARADDGFRFVWARDEGELVIFQLVVAAVSALMVVSTLQRSPARPQRSLVDAVLASRVRRVVVVVLGIGYALLLVVGGGSGIGVVAVVHALVAAVVLCLWTVAGEARNRWRKAALGLLTGAVTLLWLAAGVSGSLLLTCEFQGGCFS